MSRTSKQDVYYIKLKSLALTKLKIGVGGRCDCDRMVVGFITT